MIFGQLLDDSKIYLTGLSNLITNSSQTQKDNTFPKGYTKLFYKDKMKTKDGKNLIQGGQR